MKLNNPRNTVLLFRWAQFFIHPLMIRDAIDREVEAVDSGKEAFYVSEQFVSFIQTGC